jgi:hypothetical protein
MNRKNNASGQSKVFRITFRTKSIEPTFAHACLAIMSLSWPTKYQSNRCQFEHKIQYCKRNLLDEIPAETIECSGNSR